MGCNCNNLVAHGAYLTRVKSQGNSADAVQNDDDDDDDDDDGSHHRDL